MEYPTQSSMRLTLDLLDRSLQIQNHPLHFRLKLSPVNKQSLFMILLTAWKKLSVGLVLVIWQIVSKSIYIVPLPKFNRVKI